MTITHRTPKHRSNSVRAVALPTALAAACLLLAPQAPALRTPTEQPIRPVRVHVQWNQQYLSLAARVPDSLVTGSSSGPMSAPEQDDAIEFCFEPPISTRPAPAHRLIISSAGGMTLLTREASGRWRPDDSWTSGMRTVKYAVEVNGTLNDPTDQDIGFVVECAIPWDFLHGAPINGPDLGFNVLCWTQGESEGLTSWAPAVQRPDEAGESTRWGRMRIGTGAALDKAQHSWIACPYVSPTPVIDGKLAANEWLAAGVLEFEKPAPTLTAIPAPVGMSRRPPLLLALYTYDWQWGSASAPGTSFWGPNGTPATADQPMEAAGPWYTSERVDWHRAQLEGIQYAGIDIILPRYSGDQDARRGWARANLDYLGEALKHRRAEGKSYPLVGMMIDAACLQALDLTSEYGKRRLYAMIREFFLHVSPEFWADLPPPPNEYCGGLPILLGEPDGLADWDGGFLEYCNQRFAEDFGGARLAWLGSSAWRTRGAEGFYTHVRLPDAANFAQEGMGGVPAVALAPGYCPPPGAEGEIRPRREGRAYRGAWQQALSANAELILIDSWNDFANGTEIAPSRQYGVAYVDVTRFFKARLGSQQQQPLRLKKHTVPQVLNPGNDCLVELLVENLGTEDINTGRNISADYRIVRRSDGQVVQDKFTAQSLSILAGQTKRLPVVITARDDKGEPLPPGDYLFSLRVVSSKIAYLRSRWFTRSVSELTVPITIGQAPERRATIVSTSLPSAMEWGATEQVVVRLRNDGSEPWYKDRVSLSYRWLLEQHEDDSGSPIFAKLDQNGSTSNPVRLPSDVAPGEVVSLLIPVTAAPREGAPEPLSVDSPDSYRIQWELVEEPDTLFSAVGAPLLDEAIQLVPNHLGVLYESAVPPAVMEVGEDLRVALTLRNGGPYAWRADQSSVSYRWHRWDGREAPTPGARQAFQLPHDVEPGATVSLQVPLEAPPTAASYWLTWSTTANGEMTSQCRNSAPVARVTVRSQDTRALDLSSLLNVAAMTTDSHRSRGDFDVSGRSLPAEWLAPDESGSADDLYPSGYYAPQAAHAIPFAFPDAFSGVAGAVACVGQNVPLGDRAVSQVHLLTASTAGACQTVFRLSHPDGRSTELPANVPSWTELEDAAALGAFTPYTRTLNGDDPDAPAYLYHLVLQSPPPGAVSLELPQAPQIKILAITVTTE